MGLDCMMLCLWVLTMADVRSLERLEFASLRRVLALALEQPHVTRLGAEFSHWTINLSTTLVLVSM